MAEMHQLKSKEPLAELRDPHDLEAELRDAIQSKLTYDLGKSFRSATDNDWYRATALAVRDRLVDIWMTSRRETKRLKKKRVYYLSIEFLIGRLLLDTLTNLRLVEPARRALASMGVDLDRLRGGEPDAALGNGGLGRLAACFMDSMSALGIPAYGYGIRYENGLFEQRIQDGWQHEVPEDWLAGGNPWEFARPDTKYPIGFGGTIEPAGDAKKRRPLCGIRPRPCWRCPTIRRLQAGVAATPTCCGCGRRGRPIRSSSRHSTKAIWLARRRCARAPKRYPAFSTPMTALPWARNFGFGRNIFSPRPRCRT